MSQDKVYFTFINLSHVPVNIYWLSHRTKRKLYCTLRCFAYVEINTFVGHCWIFEDANTGDCLLGNNSCVFIPQHRQSREGGNRLIRREKLLISQPCRTLTGLSLNAVRDNCRNLKEAEDLMLPRTLKDELLHILKLKNCLQIHKANCSKCPFDIHKTHILHKCNMGRCLKLLKTNDGGRLVRLPDNRLTCIPDPPQQSQLTEENSENAS